MAPSPQEKEGLRTFITQDGTPSLYDPVLDETYHSGNGAIAESKHVFIDRGFYAPSLTFSSEGSPLRILEVGFGTGINAWLTLLEAERVKRPVTYESIEPYPLSESTWRELERALGPADGYFETLHRAAWDEACRIGPYFELRKRMIGLENLNEKSPKAALIYYDAFGAKASPEMWEARLLKKALQKAGDDSVFVTYAAKGSLKRTLRDAGWKVEVLEGALGKREMVRGIKRKTP